MLANIEWEQEHKSCRLTSLWNHKFQQKHYQLPRQDEWDLKQVASIHNHQLIWALVCKIEVTVNDILNQLQTKHNVWSYDQGLGGICIYIYMCVCIYKNVILLLIYWSRVPRISLYNANYFIFKIHFLK